MTLACHRAPRSLSPLSHLERLVHPPREHRPRERMFNVPVVVLSLLAAMSLIHALTSFALSVDQATDFLVLFAFIPARYDVKLLSELWWVPGWGAAVWTFLTYAFIHGNLMHLGFNGVWLLAFGSPVARRFGPLRFLIFFLFSAAVGAALHLAVHSGERLPMVGASAAISGAMAAAMRFAFQRGGPLGPFRINDEAAYRVPATPLSVLLRDRRFVVFLIVWFGVNLLFGLGIVSLPGEGDMPIAWEAHIGGFLAGMVTFALFDPAQVDAPSEESIEA
jgi:membrane associated rhomboid family serine protease